MRVCASWGSVFRGHAGHCVTGTNYDGAVLQTVSPPHPPTPIPFSVCHQLIQLSPSIPSRGYSPDYSACVRAACVCASVRRPAVFLGQFLPAEHLGMSYPNWGGWMDTPLHPQIEEKLIFRSG